MTDDQYRQLVAFLGDKFGEVDARFAQVDARFAQVDARFAQVDARFAQVDGRFAQVWEAIGGLRAEIRQVGDTAHGELQDFRAEVRRGFDEVKSLIRIGHADLDRRLRRLESE